MNTIEETRAWAGIAAALAMIAGSYVGYTAGHFRGSAAQWAAQYRAELAKIEKQQARLAAERAKRDVRGRYIPQARRPF
jgi:membrane protein YqaA with SNARE-associated domain